MISKQYAEKQALLDKELKREQKEIKEKEKEKEKDHKEHKDKEIVKEAQLEKLHEVFKPFAEAAAEAAGQPIEQKIVEHKPVAEKALYKEQKLEKFEIKEHKLEKLEFKEHKIEKLEIKELDKVIADHKLIYEGPLGQQQQGGDPLAQRVAALEAVVTQLLHFIPAEMRPDLSQGALKDEPGAQKHGEASAASSAKEGKK